MKNKDIIDDCYIEIYPILLEELRQLKQRRLAIHLDKFTIRLQDILIHDGFWVGIVELIEETNKAMVEEVQLFNQLYGTLEKNTIKDLELLKAKQEND